MKKLFFLCLTLVFGVTIIRAQFTSSSFATPVSLVSGSGSASNPQGVVTPDLDGDGKPDIVVTNYGNNTISVFRNIFSTGTFSSSSVATKVDYTCPIVNLISSGDIDGDGHPDLAIPSYNSSSTLFSLFRDSSTIGTINLAAITNLNANYEPAYIAIGDIDGDGKNDLVVTNYYTGNVSIFRNTGTAGTFSFAAKVDISAGSGPSTVAIADLDGDGKNDIVVTNYTSYTITVYRNTNSSGSISSSLFSASSYSTPYYPNFIKIDDIDGDGKKDILTSNYGSNNISIFRNTSTVGTISLATRLDYATGSGTSCTQGSAIVDLDGDGKKDIAVVNRCNNTFSVFQNQSTPGTISLATQVTYSTGNSPCDLSFADFNGDGKQDIILTNNVSTNTVYVYINQGTIATAPTTGPSNMSFSGINNTSMTVNFTKGNGSRRIVLCKAASAVSAAPVTGTPYTANAVFGSGSQIGTGNYVVYSDTGSSFTLTGLTANTTYYFAVFEYNGIAGFANYLTTAFSYLTGSQATTNTIYYYSKSTGNLNSLSTWGTNVDGTGTAPSSFSSGNSYYFVFNNFSPTVSANMTITGGNTAFVVGDGVNTYNLTIPAGISITTDTFILKKFSAVTINGSLNGAINIFEDTTTAQFLSSAAQNIPTANYYNLIVGSSVKTLNNGNVVARNSLTLMSSVNVNNYVLMLGTSTSQLGTLNYVGGTIYGGTMFRWFAASTNSGSSGLFPIGTASAYRPAQINFTTAPTTGGSLAASFQATVPNNSGLPLVDYLTSPIVTINKAANSGTWMLTPGTLSGGSFTASLTATGFYGVTNDTALRLIRRSNSSQAWTLTGTAQLGTGTNASPVVSRTGMNLFGEFGIGGDSGTNALPIKLIILTVQQMNNDAYLSWQTAQEINSDHFVVLRSTDNKNREAIGKVKSIGNSNEIQSYSFDNSLKDLIAQNTKSVYYQLQQVDKDGMVTNSNIIALNLKQLQNPVLLYPLPLKDILNATTNNGEIINTVSVFDLSGREIISASSSNIDVSAIAQGMYIAKVATDKEVYFIKITK